MNRRNLIALIVCSIILMVGLVMTVNNNVISTLSDTFVIEK